MTAETVDPPAALDRSDPLDRIRAGVDDWLSTRPRLVRALRISRLVAGVASLVLLVVVLLAAPLSGMFLLNGLVVLPALAVALLLTPTRSIGPVAYLRVIAVGIVWAPVVAAVSAGAVALGGLSPVADGGLVVIAGLVEETFKVLPFAVFALLAPSRVRRLGAADVLLIGWCLGAGFTIFEEGARDIWAMTSISLGATFARALGQVEPQVTFNPLGVHPVMDGNGHVLWSALVLGGVAVAIALARRFPRWRVLAFGVPVVALVVAAMDHALQNADIPVFELLFGWEHPWTIGAGFAWLLTAEGALIPVAIVVLWLWALLVDASRRHRSADPGESPATRATLDRIQARPAGRPVLPGLLGAGAAVGLQMRDDVLAAVAGVRAAGRMAGRARFDGVVAALGRPRVAREVAYSAAGRRDALRVERRSIQRSALSWLLVITPVAFFVATALGAAVGWTLTVGGDETWWLLGLWDSLLDWWDGLPLWVRMTAIGTAILLAWAYMPWLSLLGATKLVGWWMFGLSYGPAILRFLDDPSGTLKEYVLHTPPRDIRHDIIKLVLDYPGVKGAGAAEGIMQLLAKQRPDDYLRILDELRSIAQTTNSEELTSFIEKLLGGDGGDRSIADVLDPGSR